MIKFFRKYLLIFILPPVLTIYSCGTSKNTQTTPARSDQTVAIKSPSKSKEVDSINVQRNFIDGCKFAALDDFDSAIKSFNEVLKLDPENAPAMYQLSTIYYKFGQAADALEYIKNAVQIDGENIYYQLLLADIYTYTGDFIKSAETYEKNNCQK